MLHTELVSLREHEAWPVVMRLCRLTQQAGGRAQLVGGCVRDALLGVSVHDFDVEVFGLPAERVKSVVEVVGGVDLVGESFGVIRLKHLPIDVSLPRIDSKRGSGHRGFEVVAEPMLDFRTAASRRDFTINAIAWDPLEQRLLDPFDGSGDLENSTLRHVSESFADDPLRVLRGCQMAARFDLLVAPETVEMCARMDLEGLAAERIFEEWRKLLLLGKRPSRGLGLLRDCGWVRFFPELGPLIGCPQDPEWHPEGDVWVHTLHVCDAFAADRLGDAWEDLVVGFACLCHDFGKPATTAMIDGRWRSPGHEQAGVLPTVTFLGRLTRQEDLTAEVIPLVEHHLKPWQLWQAEASDAAVRRLARKVGRIDRLVRVAKADARGRPPLSGGPFDDCDWLLAAARRLAVEANKPLPIVRGRHLIALGKRPGPAFGPWLEACYEAQLDGRFSDVEGGVAFLRTVVGAAVD